jgi:hypothetical protein
VDQAGVKAGGLTNVSIEAIAINPPQADLDPPQAAVPPDGGDYGPEKRGALG